jgi:hypothetical protein
MGVGHTFLLDSMPIMVANERRSGSARTANELCSKTYCASQNRWYFVRNIELFADKAYSDEGWHAELKKQGIRVVTPVKLEKGQSYLKSADHLFSELVSKVRQAIESFFNWLNEKTQSASKVRIDGIFEEPTTV